MTADRANLPPPAAGPARLAPGDELGGCTLISLLGEGGMGAVFRAKDQVGREVAIKILTHAHSEGAALRLAREAQVTASLRHPGIVGVHSSGVERQLAFIVYELVEGPTLEDCLGELPLDELLPLLIQVADALGFAHARGVVHRDVKAENVLIGADGRPRVADFGLAMVADAERLTLSGDVFGTPLSMAPEQALGERSRYAPQTDVWALGVLLYRVLTGRYPITSATLHELLVAVKKAKFVSPRAIDPKIPRRLEAVCLKALRREPEDRYPDGTAFAEALEAALDPPAPTSWILPAFVVAGLPILLVLGAAAGWAVADMRAPPPPTEPALAQVPPPNPPPSLPTTRDDATQACLQALEARDVPALLEGLRTLAREGPPEDPEGSPKLTAGVTALCTELLDARPDDASTVLAGLADTHLRVTDRLEGSKLMAIALLKITTGNLSGNLYWELTLNASRLDIPLASGNLRPIVELLRPSDRPWSTSPRDPWKRYLDQRVALELRSGLSQEHPALLDLIESAAPIELGPCHWADTASLLARTVKTRSQAERLLKAAKRRDPKNPVVHFNWGAWLAKQSSYVDASRHADQAIELLENRMSRKHGMWMARAFVTASMGHRILAGDREGAKARWRELKAISPDSASDHLARTPWLNEPPIEPRSE